MEEKKGIKMEARKSLGESELLNFSFGDFAATMYHGCCGL